MPMDFLQRIQDASFPLVVHQQTDIECAAVLAAAGLVEANLPEPDDSTCRGGLILRITPMGRAELKKLVADPRDAGSTGR